MSQVAENINSIKQSLPDGVRLLAVSKFHSVEKIREAYDCGHRIFGESRVQELCAKHPQLPTDVEWHFIGHLQSNKVRQLMPCVSVIESVDSLRLLRLIDAEAARIGKRVKVLLQVHVALEEQKFGFSTEEIEELPSSLPKECPNVEFCGIMAMATNTDDEHQIRDDFRRAMAAYRSLRQGAMAECENFSTVSMGMSDDYQIAIEEGSNMIRIGTTIFGEREY